MKTAGMDGCKAGWLVVSLTKGNEGYSLISADEELKTLFCGHSLIFADMPIGLEEESYTRTCDVELRKLLGSEYASSVFFPPVRPALDAPTYVEANIISYEFTEKKLSLQTWNITPKIRQINRVLTESPEYRETVLESHPEYLFQRLNGGMIYQKKNLKKGVQHRLELIAGRISQATELFREIKENTRRSEVGEDDIVDAMVLAWAAEESKNSPIQSIPNPPETDALGLKKAIHFV